MFIAYIIFIVSFLIVVQVHELNKPTTTTISAASPGSLVQFWEEFEKDLIKCAPKEESLQRISNIMPVYQDNYDVISRPNLLNVTKETLDHLKSTHSVISKRIIEIEHRLVYNPNTFGYVMTTEPKSFNIVIITIRMLRRTGSKLPIELFLPSSQNYSVQVCEEILPSLNAKCIIFSDIMKNNHGIKRFQYKVFAMLFSSFENIIFLDSDNIAVLNPDDLFNSSLYQEYGMISWLDYWAETISPYYYEIISRPIPPNLTHYSAESGQLFLSKKKHAKTLLLAVYYNLYGPGHYYKLFSQNSHGEGDKETFYTAADYWKKPYYRMQKVPEQLNFLKYGNYDEFLAMLQPHPIDVWKKYTQNDTAIHNIRLIFIHANWPKVDIPYLMSHNSLAIDDKGYYVRAWASKSVMEERFGFDVEARLWEEVIPVVRDLYPELLSMVKQYQRVVIFESEMQPNHKQMIVFIIIGIISLCLALFLAKRYRSINKKKSV